MLAKPVYLDLEGTDLTGKSSLLKTTFRESNYSKEICFHDRGVLTHYIYNKYFNRYPEDHEIWKNAILDFLLDGNGIIILTARIPELKKRFHERNDDLFKLETVIDINHEYVCFWQKYLREMKNVKLIDVEGKSVFDVFTEAEELYKYLLETNKRIHR